jgi:hypothetical protein
MRLCLYEFVTGGGWYGCPERELPESLRREGRAMLVALAADFSALAGVEVTVLVDRRCHDLELPRCNVVEDERRRMQSWQALTQVELKHEPVAQPKMSRPAAGGR